MPYPHFFLLNFLLDLKLFGSPTLALHLVPRFEVHLPRLDEKLLIVFLDGVLDCRCIDVAHLGRVDGNQLRADLFEQCLDLGLAPLLFRLERVRLEGVEIGLATAGDDEAGNSSGVTDPEDVFVGGEPEVEDRSVRPVPHVGVVLSLGASVLVDLDDAVAAPHARRQQPRAAEREVGGPRRDAVVLQALELPHVPDFEAPVDAGRGKIGPRAVDRDRPDGLAVREQLGRRLLHVGRPHRHGALRVAETKDGILRVLTHDGDGTQATVGELRDHFSDRHVHPAQKSPIGLKC